MLIASERNGDGQFRFRENNRRAWGNYQWGSPGDTSERFRTTLR